MSGSQNMELELKLALERPDDLPALLSALPPASEVVEQKNHFFADPDGRLSSRRWMVRVREERARGLGPQARVILTLKRRSQIHRGYFQAEELEAVLGADDWARVMSGDMNLMELDAEPLAVLRSEGISCLLLSAEMSNVRHRVQHAGLCLEVDLTTFPGGSQDAEVEVETDRPEEARAIIEEAARVAAVPMREQTRGKYARLMARLLEEPS